MSDTIECPKCGKKVRKGSTFCFGCGVRLPDMNTPIDSSQEDVTLPDIDEDLRYEEPITPSVEAATLPDLEDDILPPVTEDAIGETEKPWESDDILRDSITKSSSRYDEPALLEESESIDEEPIIEARDLSVKEIPSLSWDEGHMEERDSTEVKEGMPFTEVAPPKVLTYDIDDIDQDAIQHVLPEQADATRDAVAHLFPSGRGMTSADFIDVVVGKPEKVSLKQPLQELQLAACPNCGISLNVDKDFSYPPYVFEAMGKARIDFGERKLQENDHKRAIEEFEKAKVLFEQANNEKLVSEAVGMIDTGYEGLAKYHYDQADQHMKDGQYEWAIVQYKKAREQYMLTSDTKMRVKSAEKARDAYVEWGRACEEEGDILSKSGQSREALDLYRKAAEKYREGDDSKKLKGLEKKIRKA